MNANMKTQIDNLLHLEQAKNSAIELYNSAWRRTLTSLECPACGSMDVALEHVGDYYQVYCRRCGCNAGRSADSYYTVLTRWLAITEAYDKLKESDE